MPNQPISTDEQAAQVQLSIQTTPKQPLGRWFWGAICVMALISLALSMASVVQNRTQPPKMVQSSVEASERELPAAELEVRLSKANQIALAATTQRIPDMLDEAYKPVYAAIPTYAAYHYTVWGEYSELGAAALGAVGGKLQNTVFSGLDGRLDKVGLDLDATFTNEFKSSLETSLYAEQQTGGVVGKLTSTAVNDTLGRMALTAPIGTAAAIGTGAALKSAVTSMASKIAIKLASKAAAKTGGKWAATGAGASSGAVLCSWAGPGAGFCAAAGGVGAWIVADYGIVKLDEYWNRAEFEADLRAMVDQQKNEHRIALVSAINARAFEVEKLSAETVQNHDFTLRELFGGTNAEVCAIVDLLKRKYAPMRTNVAARTSEAIQELRAVSAVYRSNLSLERLVLELEENLKSANQASITKVEVSGNLPADYRADRGVTIHVLIEGKRYKLAKIASSETAGFAVALHPNAQIATDGSISYGIALEQHLRLKWNRYFSGAGSVALREAFSDVSGVSKTLTLKLPITLNDRVNDIEDVVIVPTEGEPISVNIQVVAKLLTELKNAPNCQ